jgi:quinol monooxygenase YgiN
MDWSAADRALARFTHRAQHVILTKLRLFPSPKQRPQVLAALRSAQGPTQVKPRCLAAQVYEEDGGDGAILYLEEWESEPEFRRHVTSELYRRILAAIDLSQSAPEICFYPVATVQGLELVRQIRNSPPGIDAVGAAPAIQEP